MTVATTSLLSASVETVRHVFEVHCAVALPHDVSTREMVMIVRAIVRFMGSLLEKSRLSSAIVRYSLKSKIGQLNPAHIYVNALAE
jgi:hypothetical protein